MARQFGRSVPGEDAAHQRSQQLHIADTEVGMGDLLDHQPGRYSGGSEATVYLGKIDADESKRTHLADEGPVERAGLVALLITGCQPVCGEPARRLLDGALLIGEGKQS